MHTTIPDRFYLSQQQKYLESDSSANTIHLIWIRKIYCMATYVITKHSDGFDIRDLVAYSHLNFEDSKSSDTNNFEYL